MDPFDDLLRSRSTGPGAGGRSISVLASPQAGGGAGAYMQPRRVTEPVRAFQTPAAPSSASAVTPVPVDGVPSSTVNEWFRQADSDRDGRVADVEARDFFLRTGLSAADLSKIWKLVKSPDVVAREGKGLTRHRFGQVLRLIALAQSGLPFTEEHAKAALHPDTWLALQLGPLPPPQLHLEELLIPVASPVHRPPRQSLSAEAEAAAAAAAAVQSAGTLDDLLGLGPSQALAAPALAPALRQQQQERQEDEGDEPLPAAAFGSVLPAAEDEDDDLFGLAALPDRQASSSQASSSASTLRHALRLTRSAGSNRDRMESALRVNSQPPSASMEAPLGFEARLPPLQPKTSAKLSMLAAANGSLFAGPANNGGVLQWADAEGYLQLPADLRGRQGKSFLGRAPSALGGHSPQPQLQQGVATEDQDSAPCFEAAVTPRKPCTCLYVDAPGRMLWVGDSEGCVSCYDLSGEPGLSVTQAQRLHVWQAFRIGHVSAICVTPQGEVWTGSSRGHIRVWTLGQPLHNGQALEAPACRELRRSNGDRPHNSPVSHLLCDPTGQLVWSGSARGMLLWDAACGAFLGVLHRPKSAASAPDLQATPNDAAAAKYKLDTSKGLEVDPLTGLLLARPAPASWAPLRADQEAWAAQTDTNMSELMERMSIGGSKVVQSAGKAVRFFGKLGKNLTRGMANDGGSSEAQAQLAAVPAARLPSGSSLVGLDEDALASNMQQAAVPSAAAEPSTSVVTAVATPDGHVWLGYKRGRAERFSFAGKLVWARDYGSHILSMCAVGTRVWVGFADGMVSVVDSEGTAVKVFQAHAAGIISMVQAGSRVYTLAANGSMTGWSSAVPSPEDEEALHGWDIRAIETTRRESINVLCITWNVNERKPEQDSAFFRWVHETAFSAQLAVVACQEIEMGSSSVAIAAAKDVISYKMAEKGNTNAKFWGASVLSALGGERHWHQVGLRQLSGMLVMVFARNQLREHIGEVATASVACGVLGVGGNKGAVAVEFTLHRRKVAVVCSHFAAHQGAVEQRNANYAAIMRQLTFNRKPWFVPVGGGSSELGGAGDEARNKPAQPAFQPDEDQDSDSDSSSAQGGNVSPVSEVVQGEGVRQAELLLWMGDFNYRIEGTYEEVKERAIRNELGPLLEADQCRREMAAGRVFRGMREGPIRFRPTYKFDKATANPFAYDSSEKRRIPAWCDRIFFRGTVPFATPEPVEGEAGATNGLDRGVVVQCSEYNCWADVNDSDHKPVYCMLSVDLPITDFHMKRNICNELLQEGQAAEHRELHLGAVSISPTAIKLDARHLPFQGIVLSAAGAQQAVFFAVRHSDPVIAAASPLARCLSFSPANGVVPAGSELKLAVHLASDDNFFFSQPVELQLEVLVGFSDSVLCGGEELPLSLPLTCTILPS